MSKPVCSICSGAIRPTDEAVEARRGAFTPRGAFKSQTQVGVYHRACFLKRVGGPKILELLQGLPENAL